MWRRLQRERYGGGANCDAEKREKKGGKFLHEVIIDCLRPEAFDSWGRSGVARFAAPFFTKADECPRRSGVTSSVFPIQFFDECCGGDDDAVLDGAGPAA